ncbi:hypothetical protein M011DRAFT_219819 [Sporormia fimetaria CBS 119925]|uniref:Uncharacterized protein n=1 Tax=Sporormia fimetaria CBS 119925 TaxID=1340428 RepID=A0A6A6V1U9_9PLEO|nr:hypothetical protein M011DRAFT_219819 [Sporormia fimetaria CBS 119925]
MAATRKCARSNVRCLSLASFRLVKTQDGLRRPALSRSVPCEAVLRWAAVAISGQTPAQAWSAWSLFWEIWGGPKREARSHDQACAVHIRLASWRRSGFNWTRACVARPRRKPAAAIDYIMDIATSLEGRAALPWQSAPRPCPSRPGPLAHAVMLPLQPQFQRAPQTDAATISFSSSSASPSPSPAAPARLSSSVRLDSVIPAYSTIPVAESPPPSLPHNRATASSASSLSDSISIAASREPTD